jgi:SAM-dependent methyltransferase
MTTLPLELIEGGELDVVTEIGPGDEMYKAEHHDHYFRAGRSALRCIGVAMLAAGKEDAEDAPRKILDLPSGHGRIMRALKAAFPEASLTACDINHDGVEFCAEVFGATPAVSQPRGDDVDLQDRFDLIWCGSLLTHLNRDKWPGFLSLFQRSLAPGGLVVFSVFGSYAAERMRSREFTYRMSDNELASILPAYDKRGFGYSDYPGLKDSGMSLASPSWVTAQLRLLPRLRLVNYTERAWHSGANSHQDVVACVRSEG